MPYNVSGLRLVTTYIMMKFLPLVMKAAPTIITMIPIGHYNDYKTLNLMITNIVM